MKKIYKQPVLDGHSILYDGKRYLIFSVSEKTPFEGYENYSQVIIYDRLHGYVLGCSYKNKIKYNVNEFNGYWVKPINDLEEFHCNGIKDLMELTYRRTRKLG